MKTLNFVIPVYTEEKRFDKTVSDLLKGFKFKEISLKKIIFVDDGSSDATAKLIQKYSKSLSNALNCKVHLISYKPNKGKGFAVKTGMLASKADYTLFFDADMSTPLEEFKKFIPFILQGKDVIIGTRKNGHSTVVVPQPLYRQVLGRGFTLLSNIILNTWVTDFTCGFKAFSNQATQNIFATAKINRWGYDSELMFLSKKLGYSIQEVPVVWINDDRSRVNLLQDLPGSLKELFSIRWNAAAGRYDNAVRKSKKTVSFPTARLNKLYNG
jgi:dolichyl-phosphate beta-glucosyltransferase